MTLGFVSAPELYWFFAAATFLFGLLFGSFLNVCIYRLPRGLSVVSPRSACPSCATPISAFDNVPVLSWLLLRGKCRQCGARITPRYAFVELLTAALFLVCYLSFGGPTLVTLKACAFSFLTLGLIFTDFETHLLPDALTLPGIALGLLFSLFAPLHGVLEAFFGFDSAFASTWNSPRLLSFADAVLGAAVGAGMVYGVAQLYLRLRGIEGMGLGDVKLMGMFGAFLGVQLTIFVLFAASFVGALCGVSVLLNVYRKRLVRYRGKQPQNASSRAWHSASLAMRFYEMPFGVFLGSMAFVAMFYGHSLIHWYLQLFTR